MVWAKSLSLTSLTLGWDIFHILSMLARTFSRG
jgi:hypothetical protein